MKKKLVVLAALAMMSILPFSCGKTEPDPVNPDPGTDPDPEQPELVDLKGSVPITGNWVYQDKPAFTIHVENPNAVKVNATARVRISTDKGKNVATIEKEVEVPANGSIDVALTTDEKLDPGFYKASCLVNGRTARRFNFGINPTDIVSAPDKQPDFDQFWADAKAQLAAIDMKANLIELPKKSNAKSKVYMVELQSVPDGLEGDPVTVRGYYLEPQDGKKHPVIMHFYGYDTRGTTVYCPSGNDGEYAEFYLSHRGQYINRAPANKRGDGLDMDFTDNYGDWFAFQFGDKDGYYYRGAFMDCVQAVRFMATRETSDMKNLFGEGSSQGGALSYATAALSDYPFAAIAPCVAFLGDFPDYFSIVDWPANTARNAWKKYVADHPGLTEHDMFVFLSYFDTKNLATRISCPVIASSNLQDGTCPSHTNMAPFNNLLTPADQKEIHFYPDLQHVIPSDWPAKTSAFFKAHTR